MEHDRLPRVPSNGIVTPNAQQSEHNMPPYTQNPEIVYNDTITI